MFIKASRFTVPESRGNGIKTVLYSNSKLSCEVMTLV
jgi:hypothetical protein